MSKFSVSDKVSFINEKQDGIIQSVSADGMYIVEIEDGFTINAHESELVLIRQQKAGVSPKPVASAASKTAPLFIGNLPSLSEGIWLVSCPAAEGMVNTGPASFYIVNNSPYAVLAASSFVKNNIYTGISANIIEAGNQFLVTTLKREEAFDKGDFFIQLILHKTGMFEVRSTASRQLTILFPGHSTAINNIPAPYAFCRLHLIESTTALQDIPDEALNIKADELRQKMMERKSPKSMQKGRTAFSDVDLHIEELSNTFAGLSSTDIINLQLNHFRKKLDEAILSRQYKITFIHGAGNGILKSAVRKELEDLNLPYEDAPYEAYGGGATVVYLQ